MNAMRAARRVVGGLLSLVLTVVAGAAVFASAVVWYGEASGKYKFQPVLSGSMEPLYRRGDLVYSAAEPNETLKVGDLIVFIPCKGSSGPVMHRIFKITAGEGTSSPTIMTRGDNNIERDANGDPVSETSGVDPWGECQLMSTPTSQTTNALSRLLHKDVAGKTYVVHLKVPVDGLGSGSLWLQDRRHLAMVGAAVVVALCLSQALKRWRRGDDQDDRTPEVE